MKIAIDCFKLVKGRGKSIGIYNYTHTLIRGLSEHYDGGIQFFVFGNQYNQTDFMLKNIEFIQLPLKCSSRAQQVYWETLGVKRYIRKYGVDLTIFPRGFIPYRLFSRQRYIPVIHDLIPFFYNKQFPDYFNRMENLYVMKRLAYSVKSADRVLTISEASKRDILQYIDPEFKDRIKVIHNSYVRPCLNVVNVGSDPEEPYILAITSKLPHKNLAGILNAYRQYARHSSAPIRLKIVGAVREDVPDDLMTERVDLLGYVDDETLKRLYAGAKLFVFLSLKEGFGYPPVEANAFGIPVICSNASSIPEVMGDAAVFVDPADYKAIATAIDKMIHEDPSSVKKYVENGFININRFHIDSYIGKMLQFIEENVNGR